MKCYDKAVVALALQVDIGDAVRAADLLVDGVLATAVAQ